MTGDGISKTITDTTTGLTVSEHHGTGADTITLGTETHGIGTHGLTRHGHTEASTTRTTSEDGMIHGTTATEDGTEDGTAHTTATCILTTPAGMADGTHIGDITTIIIYMSAL